MSPVLQPPEGPSGPGPARGHLSVGRAACRAGPHAIRTHQSPVSTPSGGPFPAGTLGNRGRAAPVRLRSHGASAQGLSGVSPGPHVADGADGQGSPPCGPAPIATLSSQPLSGPGPWHLLGPLTVTLSSPLPAPLVNTLKSATSFTRTPLGCKPRPEARQALGLQAGEQRTEEVGVLRGPGRRLTPHLTDLRPLTSPCLMQAFPVSLVSPPQWGLPAARPGEERPQAPMRILLRNASCWALRVNAAWDKGMAGKGPSPAPRPPTHSLLPAARAASETESCHQTLGDTVEREVHTA